MVDDLETINSSSSSSSSSAPSSSTSTAIDKLRFRFLSVVGFALFCDYLLLTLLIPLVPNFFSNQFGSFPIAALFACKPTFQFFANPMFGKIVDRTGPKSPLLLGVVVLALATFVFAVGLSLNHNLHVAYALCFVARSVQGIASASTMSAGMTLVAATHPESLRGAAIGTAMTGIALGVLLGPTVGGLMGYYINYW
jgi:DHA1 family solute carrier family 18 vesicular amine transporter 1/2